jgi:hypothetical protein
MKNCPKCYNENPSKARYCRVCGRYIRFTPAKLTKDVGIFFLSLFFGNTLTSNLWSWREYYASEWTGTESDLYVRLIIITIILVSLLERLHTLVQSLKITKC